MSIVLIDATSDSLTVSWTDRSLDVHGNPIKKSSLDGPQQEYYVLQYQMVAPSNIGDDSAQNDSEFTTLSDALRMTQVRKKNLLDPNRRGFRFRVGSRTKEQEPPYDDALHWIAQAEPFYLLTKEQETHRMDAPKVRLGGSNASLLVSWTVPFLDATYVSIENGNPSMITYEIQMRENYGGVPWTTISAAFVGTEVRKNNLPSAHGYQFRIRPNRSASSVSDEHYFSPPSEPVVAWSYSNSGIQKLFQSLRVNMLLSNRLPNPGAASSDQAPLKVNIEDALGGKEFVLFYISAHWCGPCRNYTPKLIHWYKQQLSSSSTKSVTNFSPVEVVFVSADHDMKGFTSYYRTMPWTAIPYDHDAREQVMSLLKVRGIPRLVVYDCRSGKVVEENAVGKPLDLSRWRKA